ncbi:hypothetical protein AcV7_000901 [Taiwanofungus camphoratus]|nr:hypothetical protein AcV7_000901 [Antrodia cinnamomea]
MSRDMAAYVVQHHNRVAFTLAPVLALAALSATPLFIPLVLLLAVLQLHLHILLPRRNFSAGLTQVILISVATSLTHIGPSLNALSTPATSIIMLVCLSGVSTVISLAAMILSYYGDRFMYMPWSKLTLFPAIWATVWGAVAYVGPVGRLMTWSPVLGLGPYAWVHQVSGQWGLDWIVASWSVVFAELLGNWMVGCDQDDDGTHITSFTSENHVQSSPHVQNTKRPSSRVSQSRHVGFLATLLVLFAVPSFFISTLPLPPVDTDSSTAFQVACALPDLRRSGRRTLLPTLHDYISESATLQSSADLILWPEGAVRFQTPEQKEAAFEEITHKLQGKKYFGISFEDFVPESSNNSRRAGIRRNGLVLLGPQGPVLEYYKRRLVPIAESFSFSPSSDLPPMYTIELPSPKNYNKTVWSPTPGHVRPIPLTASVCLDFSSSSSFDSLPSRPALILAPARTWHIGVGYAMWEQAKARAEETGSMVLWCDGGDGGVSGIAGGGMHEFVQVGQGSFVKKIGIQYPFDQRRTFYSLGGEFAALVMVWGIMGVGSAVDVIFLKLTVGGHNVEGAWLSNKARGVVHPLRRLHMRFVLKRDEERPLLE